MGCATPPPLAASVPLAGIPLQLILDASAESVHILELNGDSFRLKHSKRRISDDQPPTVPG
jgi:hypothetical protein